MPNKEDLKRLIRNRMQKTGESYTAARSQIVKSAPRPAEYASIAGMSDEAVRSKTGRTWQQWVRQLDAIGAARMPHREIAKRLNESREISGWWAQTVTVGYERIRGLREVGQSCDGRFQASKSKTFAVPISRLYRTFSVKRTRTRWLGDVDMTIRTATVDKSMRITWPDGTSVQAQFTAKGPKKSQVAIQHSGLARKKDIADRKEFWAEKFASLSDIL